MELCSCHPLVTQNCEVAARFSEKLYTTVCMPVSTILFATVLYNYKEHSVLISLACHDAVSSERMI